VDEGNADESAIARDGKPHPCHQASTSDRGRGLGCPLRTQADVVVRSGTRGRDGRGRGTPVLAGTVCAVRDDRHARHRRADTDRRRRPVDGFRATDPRRFERLVEDAIAALPEGLLTHLDDVQITVADVPPPDPAGTGSDEILLARYRGAPKTGRGRGDAALPDRLTLFRRPLEARANSKAELAELVREAVVHEIAHHLGIDDDRLDELGWG
jgi:predicted Zn-dependent protease with MMP-like domain